MSLIGRGEEDPHVAQYLYPLMQAVDIKHLNVDIAFGDTAQRKVHMIAREFLPALGYKKPIAIHHKDMLGLTGGKMSASKPETCIMIDESPEQIKSKIMTAYCPAKQIKDNPILQICEHIIFERQNKKQKSLKVERPKKFGGDISFKSYEELVKAYQKDLHPLDLKKTVALSLIKILEPVRKKFASAKIQNLKRKIAKAR